MDFHTGCLRGREGDGNDCDKDEGTWRGGGGAASLHGQLWLQLGEFSRGSGVKDTWLEDRKKKTHSFVLSRAI